jgi:glutaredoxin
MKRVAISVVFIMAIAAVPVYVSAQQMYRIVGPDGRITFSDQPPPPSDNAKVTTGRGGSFNESSGGGALPFELRTIAQRFPVTIYTSKDCAPCDTARNLLRNRGVPFTERTIESPDDADSLKRISGDTSMPFATIGSQQLKGFSDVEWTQFLDAAGYPKTSQLPANYRNPAPAPLVARAAPAPASAPVPTAPTQAPAAEPTVNPNNPSGIRF